MMVLTLFLNTLTSYYIAALFNSVIIFFISFVALIIFNLEILSLFKAINEVNIIFFQILLLIIAFFINKKFNFPKISINFDLTRFLNSFKLDKSLVVLFVAWIFMMIIEFILASIVPAGEADSQTYHFYRAYEFVRQMSLNHFETNDARALVMPINSEILYTWLLCFKKNFFGYALISYFSYFLILISSFDIMEYLKISYRKRLFAIFIFSSLASVVIQMSSMQTDILVGAFLITSLALYLKNKNCFLYFSSLSLALVCGTKSTGVMAVLAMLLLFCFIDKVIKKDFKIKRIILFISYLIANFIIFSSYNYILNFIEYGNFLSNHAIMLGHRFWGGIGAYVANIIRYSFQGIDFTGFTWGYYINNFILMLEYKLINFLHIDLLAGCNVIQDSINIEADEQRPGFGILGILVLFPMFIKSIIMMFNSEYRKDKKVLFLFGLTLAFIINILVLSGSVAYMVYSIRFILSFMILSFIVITYSYIKKGFYKNIIVIFCLFYMCLLSTHIKRMPFFIVLDELKKCGYNLNLLEEKFFKGEVYMQSLDVKEVYNLIQTKYKVKKKIAVIRTTKSVIFYLKNLEKYGYTVDFLNPALITDEKLNKYDLIVTEGKIQDDNTFTEKNANIDYVINGEKIIFNDKSKLNCYYMNTRGKAINNIKDSMKRNCFTYEYITNNNGFDLDFVQNIYIKTLKRTDKYYYFVKK